jgi:hypothetical protein
MMGGNRPLSSLLLRRLPFVCCSQSFKIVTLAPAAFIFLKIANFFLQPPKWIIYQVGDVPQVTSRPPEAVEAGRLSRISSL